MQNKSTKKKGNHNAIIVHRLIDKYGVSKRFITMSLNGDRVSETSDAIKKDYGLMMEAVNELLKNM